MNNNIRNVRGFTLVELLAVIVVLAIVMLAAVTAVIPRMTEARKQVFSIEANGAIDSAQAYFMNGSLTNDTTKSFPVDESSVKCVTIETLVKDGYSELDSKKYTGRVIVKKVGSVYVYAVSLQNGQLMVLNEGFEDTGKFNQDVTSGEVKDYNSGTFSTYAACSGVTTFPSSSGGSSGGTGGTPAAS